MENPLRQIVPVEDRADGVYIKITREQKEKLPLEAIIRALDIGMVVNYETSKIADIWNRARGAFEKIGPAFEYYDSGIEPYVDVSIEPLKATVTVSSTCISGKHKPTEKGLVYCLGRKGIRYGIKHESVRELLKSNAYDSKVVIAEGTPPVDGQNGTIHFEVDVNPEKKPKVMADGSVDFRDIQTFTQVAKGQVIARCIAPAPGIAGRAVTGESMPASPGKEYTLSEGRNVVISEDKKYLLANVSGIIFEERGLLSINEKLNINSDVDFNIGNIKFSGSVIISGNVKPGFTVESEDDIEIRGDVESATIKSRNGSVFIHRGVIGNAVIFGKKSVRIAFAQNSTVTTEGLLTVDRFCMHCTCTCDSFESHDNNGGVIGGYLQAYTLVKTANAGNEKDVVTKIEIIDKEKAGLESKLSELEKLRRKLEDELTPIKKQLSTKAALFKQAGEAVTDRHREELKKWVNLYNAATMKFEYVTKNIGQIKDKLNMPSVTSGEIVISGDVFPATQIGLYGMQKLIKAKITKKRFVIKNAAIEIEG